MDFPEQLSEEDLKKISLIMEQIGEGIGTFDSSIGALCKSHSRLAGSLEEFDLISAARLISSLETFPDLHENTIRLEVLLHLAVARCKGTKKANVYDLKDWIQFLDSSPMASQEDPTEDVFIGYVCSPNGGFRIFSGIFSNGDFILERLLFFLSEKTTFPGILVIYESILELLKLSDAIADELGHRRYSVGHDCGNVKITIPPDDRIEAHSRSVSFDHQRLNRLGIKVDKLHRFTLNRETLEDVESSSLFGSQLEKQPIIEYPSGIVVASPSSLCRAAIVAILEEVVPMLGGWADTFYEKESAEFFVNKILRRIGIRPNGSIKTPKIPESLSPLYPFIGQFDYGKPVVALLKCSQLTKGSNLEEPESHTDEQDEDFERYIEECCAACENVEGFNGGLILLGIAAVGRPVIMGLGNLRPSWQLFSAGLADWQTLASENDFQAKRLWSLAQQMEIAKRGNVKIMNPSGLLNLYAFWRQNDFSFVPTQLDLKNPHNMLALDGSYSSRLNTELKTVDDRHCRISHDQKNWVLLQRQGRGLNPDLDRNKMYYSSESVSSGVLRGCVEHNDTAWWLESACRPKKSNASDLLYRLWDCVFNWLERSLPVLDDRFPDLASGSVSLELEFPKMDEWEWDDVEKLQKSSVALEANVDADLRIIKLVINEGFLGKFHRADNLAESEIVSAIVKSAAAITGEQIAESTIAEITLQITKNEHSRFFHLLRSSSLESALAAPGSAEPTFIPYEEVARARIGLAYLVDKNPPASIKNRDQAVKFLGSIVAALQARVSDRLRQLHILPIVSRSFDQLDELSRDGTRWNISTRSLLSLEDGAPWIHERLRKESGRLSLAEISNRILIETSVYSVDPDSTEVISQFEHTSLLADLSVMIELANCREAIANGFVGADLTIHPNGMIDYDASFHEKVFEPYLRSRIDDKIQWAADDYERNFRPRSGAEELFPDVSAEVLAFETAFVAEFGFPAGVMGKVIDFFDTTAVAQQQAGGHLDSKTFRAILKNKIDLTETQITTFLDRFVLPIRPSWDKKLPKGCGKNDVLPWRYWRGLSLLVRPFVEVSRAPRRFAVSAPHLHRWQSYLVNSMSEGYLPGELFHSPKMKSYLGSIANKKGDAFTRRVSVAAGNHYPCCRIEVNMTELRAPKNPDLGDVDVLAWNPTSGSVLVIECKHLKTTLTVGQVIQQLEDFKGDIEKADYLGKHNRRVNWLRENPAGVSLLTGIAETAISWQSLLVTSGRVPMSFIDAIDFPKEQVVPFVELEEKLREFQLLRSHSSDPDAKPLEAPTCILLVAH